MHSQSTALFYYYCSYLHLLCSKFMVISSLVCLLCVCVCLREFFGFTFKISLLRGGFSSAPFANSSFACWLTTTWNIYGTLLDHRLFKSVLFLFFAILFPLCSSVGGCWSVESALAITILAWCMDTVCIAFYSVHFILLNPLMQPEWFICSMNLSLVQVVCGAFESVPFKILTNQWRE